MGKLLKALVCSCLLGILAFAALPTSAMIKITIYDGFNTIHAGMATNGMYKHFRLSERTSAGATTAFRLLECAHRPCTVYFPSGEEQADPLNDTYKFQDRCASPTCRASVVKRETDAARLTIYHLQITALAKGVAINKPLTIMFETEKWDLRQIGKGSFPYMPQTDGMFQQAGPNASYSCKIPNVKCVNMRADIQGSSWVSNTVSVPCGTGNPCGPTGSYSPSTGVFRTMLPARAPCITTTCDPVHKGTIGAKFTQTNQILTFYDAATYLSMYAVQDFGMESVAYAAAEHSEHDFWVSYTTANEPRSEPPKWIPATHGVVLTAIATDADVPVTEEERLRNDRAYASFIARPSHLFWKDVDELTLSYEFVVGEASAEDPRFLRQLDFQDCRNAAFYVRVVLVDGEGNDIKKLKIRLGASDDYKSGCAGNHETNIVSKSEEKRVDASEPGGPERMLTVEQSMIEYGLLYVRSISVVIDRGSPATGDNYRVNLYEATVNGVRATDSLLTAAPGD